MPADETLGPEDRRAFEAESAATLRRDVLFFVPALALINLLYFATDPFVFAHAPYAIGPLAIGRWLLTGYAVLTVGAVLAFPKGVFWILSLAGLLTTWTVATVFGSIGGPGTAWFHFVNPFVIVPLAWFHWPWQRLLSSLVYATVVLAGYFAGHPDYLLDPLFPTTLGFFAFVLALVTVSALYEDRRRLAFFLARRALQRERATLAEQVATQTADLRRLALRLDAAGEAERKHVARELHDELGQTLTAIRLVLKLTTRRFERDPSAIAPNLAQVGELVEQLSTQARRLVRDLRPPVLDQLGFSAAVEWQVARYTQHGGPPCRVSVPSKAPPLAPDVASAAFRSIQEALTNVARHASASEVQVTVSVGDDMLRVEVRDDGVGMPERPTDGVGLLGMRERASAVGGALQIVSARGEGTAIRLEVPLEIR